MSLLPYSYHAAPRSRRSLLAVAAVWGLLGLGWTVFAAHPLFLALGAACTLPALYEIAFQPAAWLRLDARRICWRSPRAKAEIALAQVDHLRLDTRLDLSVRASVVLKSGRRLRLPVSATPPAEALDAAATAAGLAVRRQHFSLLG